MRMVLIAVTFIASALFAAGCGGCGGCGGGGEEKEPEARRPSPAPPAQADRPESVTPSRTKTKKDQRAYRHRSGNKRVVFSDKTLRLSETPRVTPEEIESDPRLDNPRMPYATKRALKALEKIQKENPHLTKPDSWYKSGADDSK